MASDKKITLITGANSGIGFEVAAQLLADASHHVLLGSRSKEKGAAAVKELEARGLPGSVELVVIDVKDEDSVAAAAKAVDSAHGRLDALVNNAGIARAEGTEAQQMVEVFRVNTVGVLLVGDYFTPLLRKSTGTPRIVDVTSGAGSITNRLDPNGIANTMRVLPYRASKTAMHMVFATQVRELGPHGIKVFLYGPGHTVSNLGPASKLEYGAKPTSEGAAPITAMVNGTMDGDAGTYIEHGLGIFPW